MKGLLKILCYIFYFPCLRNSKNHDHSNSHELEIITKEKKDSDTESKIINEINNEYDNNYNIIKNNKIYNFWYKSKSVDENIINSSYEINTENNKILEESLSSISSNDNNNDDDNDLNIVPNNSPCNSPKILNIPTNYSVSPVSSNININISPNFSYLTNKD